MITNLLTDERKLILTRLLNREKVEVGIDDRISLKQLSNSDDKAFYSLLVQGGYLSVEEYQENKDIALVSIPNHELLTVWRNFIFGKLYNSAVKVNSHTDNIFLLAKVNICHGNLY